MEGWGWGWRWGGGEVGVVEGEDGRSRSNQEWGEVASEQEELEEGGG